MAVQGSPNGLNKNNFSLKRVEPLVTVDKLKRDYLFGIDILDDEGNELPKSSFEQYIANAVSMLEHFLDLSINPVYNYVEDKDYYFNDYFEWGYMHLDNYPVIQVRKMEMVYFREEGNPQSETVQEIPDNWIRLQPHDGIVRLIPNARFPAKLQISQSGNFFPEVLRSSMIPHLWRVTYDYGFQDGKLPSLLNTAIALLAATQALIVGGNLVIGAGIASQSISLDGLSQSIQTTQSAENSSYSATIKEYQRLLYGQNKEDPFSILKLLKDYYKGETVNLI